MAPIDRAQLLSALLLATMALFISSGMPQAGRWRYRLRIGAITLFAILLAFALVEIAIWLSGGHWQ